MRERILGYLFPANRYEERYSDFPHRRPERDPWTLHDRPPTQSVQIVENSRSVRPRPKPEFYDQEEMEIVDQLDERQSGRSTQTHKATKARQEVYVFADRKNEVIRRPAELSNSSSMEIAVLPVSCVDTQVDRDFGTWSFESQNQLVRVTGFFAAKSGDRSEDSEPLMVASSASGKERLFIGVFDGMGGAGASIVERDNNFTEAYRASRIARLECFKYSIGKVVNGVLSLGRDEVFGRDLTAHLLKSMKHYAANLGIGPGTSRIRGTLTKTLPTTLACADISVNHSSREVRIRSLWAGDSRVWVLTPSQGMQQLTRDDVDIEDPLEQLRQDPPMTNVVSASVEFSLNDAQHGLKMPCIVIAASDGVSGYVRSPGEVELLLLDSFRQAEATGSSIGLILMNQFTKIAQDDVSCVVAMMGFSSLSELNDAFAARLRVLNDRYAVLNGEMTPEEFSETVDGIWVTERGQYCGLLGGEKR